MKNLFLVLILVKSLVALESDLPFNLKIVYGVPLDPTADHFVSTQLDYTFELFEESDLYIGAYAAFGDVSYTIESFHLFEGGVMANYDLFPILRLNYSYGIIYIGTTEGRTESAGINLHFEVSERRGWDKFFFDLLGVERSGIGIEYKRLTFANTIPNSELISISWGIMF